MRSHTFAIDHAPTVALSLGSGDVEIDGTGPSGVITVEIDGEGVLAEQRRHAVAIRSERSRWGGSAASVRLTVPADTALVARTANATLVHTGSLGTARIGNAAGRISLGSVTGPVAARTGAGDIEIGEIGDSVVLHAGAGRIDLGRVTGIARIATGVGDIEVGRAEALLDLKSGTGRITIHRAVQDLAIKSGTGDVTIHHFEGSQLTARNHSGDITVGIPDGLPVWRDVVTVTGHLTSTLAPTGEPTKGGRHVEIRAVTRHGDVTLRPAA